VLPQSQTRVRSAFTRVCDALCVAGTPFRGPIITRRWLWVPALAALGRDDDRLACAKHQLAAVRNDRRGSVIVSGLLFYNDFRNSDVSAAPRAQDYARRRARRRVEWSRRHIRAGRPLISPGARRGVERVLARLKRTATAGCRAVLRPTAVGSSIHTRGVLRGVCATAATSSQSS
jgi:hypothetical protein